MFLTAATVNFRMGPGGAGFAIPINDALATAGQIRAGVRSDSVHRIQESQAALNNALWAALQAALG